MKNKRNPEVVVTALVCFGLIMMVLWVYYGAVFGEEAPIKKKEISVVLYDAGDGGWESLMEGMKQAEEDFAVNIHYVTVKEGTTGEEQVALVQQELEKDVSGVLLAAVDAAIEPLEIQSGNSQVPIVAVESSVDAAAYSFFSAGNAGMGYRLGQEILEDFSGTDALKVVVVEEYMERDSVRERAQGLYEALDGNAEIIQVQRTNDKVDMVLFLSNVLSRSNADVVVALSKEALQSLCEVDREAMEEKKVYGIGNTASIVAALERGKVEKLVFQDEFNIGYMSVKALVQQMEGIRNSAEEINFYCVGREDVHKTQYERLLFPIVE